MATIATDSAFVGQQKALERLGQFYDRALAGNATVCFVAGEPGAGKTALVNHFARQMQARDDVVVVARGECNPQTGTGDPYLPIREILSQLAGDVADEVEQGRMSAENASRLRKFAELSMKALVESGPDLVGLLIPGGFLLTRLGTKFAQGTAWGKKLQRLVDQQETERGGRLPLDENRIFDQVIDVFRTLASARPLLLIIDDMQWADEATIGLLYHLARRLDTGRVLVIGAYRPADVTVGRNGERHPLDPVLNEIRRYDGDVWVDLDADAARNGREFFDQLIDIVPNRLGEDFRDAFFARTEGHPLFTLELFHHMRDEGYLVCDADGFWVASREPDWAKLPVRLEGAIAERVGRLDEALRHALEVGCVEGERFRAQTVARVLDCEVRALVRRLGSEAARKHQIVRSEGLRDVGGVRIAEYRFRHNLFQKYLYDSLDENERAYLHEEVGNVLEDLFADDKQEIALELARHFEVAGVPEKAVRYYSEAAERARDLFATREAIHHLQKALEQLERLPKGESRDTKELDLQMRVGACLVGSSFYGAPEVKKVYERAQVLCEQLGRPVGAPVLRALAVALIVVAELARAHELGDELVRRARDEDDNLLVVEGHYVLGVTNFWLARFRESREHLERAIKQYDPEQQDTHLSLYAQDPKIVCLCRLAWTLWYLGYPDQALDAIGKGLALARELGHPPTLAYAAWIAGQVYLEIQDYQRAEGTLDILSGLGEKKGSVGWFRLGMIARGVLQGQSGAVEAGIQTMRERMAAFQEAGSVPAFPAFPQFHAKLAQLQLKRGAIDEAFEEVSQALAWDARVEVCYYQAEIHRTKGEVLLARSRQSGQDNDGTENRQASQDRKDAEQSFRDAMDIARQQEARSLELRAAMSLARLYHDNGDTQGGRAILQPVYDGFTEGFGTADLKEARALLASGS